MRRSLEKSRSTSHHLSNAELARIRGGVVTDNKHPEGTYLFLPDTTPVRARDTEV